MGNSKEFPIAQKEQSDFLVIRQLFYEISEVSLYNLSFFLYFVLNVLWTSSFHMNLLL